MRKFLAIFLLMLISQMARAQHDPPTLDMSTWEQVPVELIFGNNPTWPRVEDGDTTGVNPQYWDWAVEPPDTFLVGVQGVFLQKTVEASDGTYVTAYQDFSASYWVGFDNKIHGFASFTIYLDSAKTQKLSEDYFYVMLPPPYDVPPTEALRSLSQYTPNYSLSDWKSISTVPEPNALMLSVCGLCLLVLNRGVKDRITRLALAGPHPGR